MQAEKFIVETSDHIRSWSSKMEESYVKRKRSLDPLDIFEILTHLSGSHGYSSVIALNDSLPSVAKSSIAEFRKKLPHLEFYNLWQGNLQISKQYINPSKQRIVGIDGSKIQVSNQLRKEGYSCEMSNRYPTGMLNATVDLMYGFVSDTEMTSNLSERAYVFEQLKKFNADDIIVMDRGYYSYELTQAFMSKKIHPIFRMSTHMKTIRRFQKQQSNDKLMVFRKGKGHTRLRVIRYTINSQDYFLATTLPQRLYSVERLKELYHLRWNVEEAFKFLKQTAQFIRPHSKTENGIKQELYIHMFYMSISKTIQLINKHLLFGEETDRSTVPVADSTVPKKLKRIHKKLISCKYDHNQKRKKFNDVVLFETLKKFICARLQRSNRPRKLETILKRNILTSTLGLSYPRISIFPYGNKVKYRPPSI